jgi:hypothetical protein
LRGNPCILRIQPCLKLFFLGQIRLYHSTWSLDLPL